MTSTQVKKPSAQKLLCMFTNVSDVKKTAYRQVGADKSKRKAIKLENTPWSLKQNRKWHTKINEQIKKLLYNWIMHHPQVVRSSIANDCLKVNIDGYNEPQLVTDFLFQESVRELHNKFFSGIKDGGLKEARYEDDNIFISDSTLRSLLPPQFKTCRQDTRLCVVMNVVYLQKLCIHHYCHGVIVI